MNGIGFIICRVKVIGEPDLWLVLALTLVSGCVAAVAPHEGYDPPFSEQVLESLVGSTKYEVQERLGKPMYQAYKDDKSYYVYRGDIDTAGLMVGAPTGPIWETVPVCSLLEFSPDQGLKRYERLGGSGVALLGVGAGGAPRHCEKAFWSEDELAAHREELRKRVLTGDAEEDDAEVIYRYATALKVPEAWQWYCLAAHLGDAKAQYTRGNYYRLGLMSSRGSARPHEQDVVEAYIWYTLSFKGGYATAKKFRDRLFQEMTPAQITEAERLVAEWEPNPAECENYSDGANAP